MTYFCSLYQAVNFNIIIKICSNVFDLVKLEHRKIKFISDKIV